MADGAVSAPHASVPFTHPGTHSLTPPDKARSSQHNESTRATSSTVLTVENDVTPSLAHHRSSAQSLSTLIEHRIPVKVSTASLTSSHPQAEASVSDTARPGMLEKGLNQRKHTEGEVSQVEVTEQEVAAGEFGEGGPAEVVEGKVAEGEVAENVAAEVAVVGPEFARDEDELAGQKPIIDQDIRYADTLLPIPVPMNYPEINFTPLILSCKFLIGILIFNILCISSIITVLYCADLNHQYHTTYSNIYLVVRYIPTVVGTITTVLFRSLRYTFCRIQPYISMADQRSIRECCGSKSVGQLYTKGVRVNDRGTWAKESRHGLRLTMWICNILVVQMAGYKSALFSTAHSDEGWLVTVHYQMAWVLVSLYLLIIFACTLMLSKMWRAKTGLKWDPVRIADMLALFHGSNVLADFEELERLPDMTAFWLLRDKTYRLGYWEKGIGREIWYGIGRANPGSAPTEIPTTDTDFNALNNPIEIAKDHTTYLALPQENHGNGPSISEYSTKSPAECRGSEHRPFCGHVLYNGNKYPWDRPSMFSPWTVFFWAPFVFGTLGLLIYAVASGTVHKGFNIPTHTPFTNSSTPGQFTYNITTPAGDLLFANFDPGNGLLLTLFWSRTVLVIFASYMAIQWFGSVDESMRFSQPFKNMYEKPATADDSIFLNYLWGTPGLTTIKALMNKHWVVAWFSFISFFSPTFPILVGGIFVITNTGKRIYFSITPATFYLVFAYIVIYAISVPLAWPRRDRRLMRYHDSVADYVSLFYASYLLYDPDSKLDISAPNVTQRHLESRVFLEEKKYAVGLYRGVDRKCHFGLDVATLDVGAGEPLHVQFVPYNKSHWKERARGAETSETAARMQEIEERGGERKQSRKRVQDDIV